MQLAVRNEGIASILGVAAVAGCGAVIWSIPKRRTMASAVGIGLALLLATNLVLRASPWVAAPTVIAAAVVLLLTSRDTLLRPPPMESILAPALTFVHAALAVPFLARPLHRLAGSDRERSRTAIRATLVATAVLGVLSLLLASGDVVFGTAIAQLGGGSAWTHVLMTLVCMPPIAALALNAQGSGSHASLPLGRFGQGHGIEAIAGLGAAALVLGAWAAVQVVVVLGGADRVLEAEDLTRAEYARQGFFQLVVVAAVVIGLLNVVSRLADASHRRWFVALSATVTVETLGLIAITYRKLDLYIDAYGLTMLRLSVACFLGWLAIVLVIVGSRVMGVMAGRQWSATASLLSAILVTLGFGWVNPAAIVADVNIDRALASTATDRAGAPEFGVDAPPLDVAYLFELGPDAAPTVQRALARLSPTEQMAIRAVLCESPSTADVAWNLGAHRARQIAETTDCT